MMHLRAPSPLATPPSGRLVEPLSFLTAFSPILFLSANRPYRTINYLREMNSQKLVKQLRADSARARVRTRGIALRSPREENPPKKPKVLFKVRSRQGRHLGSEMRNDDADDVETREKLSRCSRVLRSSEYIKIIESD